MKLQDLLQERAKIAHDMRELNANAEKEDRGLSTDESQKWDRMCEKLDQPDSPRYLYYPTPVAANPDSTQ